MKYFFEGVTGDFIYYKLNYVTLIYKDETLVKIAIMENGLCTKMLSIR